MLESKFFYCQYLYHLLPNPRFSDHDQMMHFQGGDVGHKSTQNATDFFKNSCLGLSTVPCTTRTYGAVNTVPVPGLVTSEPRSDHTRRNL